MPVIAAETERQKKPRIRMLWAGLVGALLLLASLTAAPVFSWHLERGPIVAGACIDPHSTWRPGVTWRDSGTWVLAVRLGDWHWIVWSRTR